MAKKPTNTKKRKDDRRGSPKGEFGQKPHKVTPERREIVKLGMIAGATQESIAARFDPPISVETLKKHYGPELDWGKDAQIEEVVGIQMQIATDKDHKDCARTGEFLLRSKGGFRTKDELGIGFGVGLNGQEGVKTDDSDEVKPAKVTIEFVGKPVEPVHDTTGK